MSGIIGHMTEEASRDIGIALLLLGLAALVVITLVVVAAAMLIRYLIRRAHQKESSDLDPDQQQEKS